MGHTQRSCTNPQSLSKDAMYFWSYVKPEARPDTLTDLRGVDSDSYDEEEDDSDSEMELDESD